MRDRRFKWNTETFMKHMKENHPNTEIIGDFKYSKLSDKITVRCKKCGFEAEKVISNLLYIKEGCKKCSGKRSTPIEEIRQIVHSKFKTISVVSEKRPSSSKKKLEVKCDLCGNHWEASIDSLLNGSTGCTKCGKKKIRSMDDAISEIESKNPSIKVLSYTDTRTPVVCECRIDGYVWNATASALLGKKTPIKCPCCNGVVVSDKNRLSLLRPDVMVYMKYPEQAHDLTVKSSKRIELVCPHCGAEKIGLVSNLTTHPFACKICGSGASVPEKFTRAVLNQIGVEFESEYSPNWEGLNKRRYDIFIPSISLVIEIMGSQHYKENSAFYNSLEKEVENDFEKKTIVLENNCNYDTINASRSDFEWLKSNVIQTISKYFDLSCVNWEDAFYKTSSSAMIECANLYKKGYMVADIVKETGISRSVIWRYLKSAEKIGKIEYVKNGNPYKKQD